VDSFLYFTDSLLLVLNEVKLSITYNMTVQYDHVYDNIPDVEVKPTCFWYSSRQLCSLEFNVNSV